MTKTHDKPMHPECKRDVLYRPLAKSRPEPREVPGFPFDIPEVRSH